MKATKETTHKLSFELSDEELELWGKMIMEINDQVVTDETEWKEIFKKLLQVQYL
jgi:hypothetical protein